ATRGAMRLRLISTASIYGFRDAVAFDLGGGVLGHDSDDESADNRDQDDPRSQIVEAGAGEIGGSAVEEEEVREQSDELVESVGDNSGNQPDPGGEERNQQHPELRGL